MSYERKLDPRPRTLENWSAGMRPLPQGTALATEAGKLLEDVRIALGHDLGGAIKAAADLAALLEDNLPEMPRALTARGGLAPWQKRKVEEYIERRLAGPIHVEDVAGLVSLSPGHFSRAFKESFGDTPHAYIMRMRLSRAQQLMLTTPDPLSQIALACGHADQAHFTKRFRAETGETPNAWRRRHTIDDWAVPNPPTGSGARGTLPDGLAWTAAAG
jgi:AraC family transcriptional regulator